jgi:DNA invertase Pin-like site-specific DNA recombinase
LTNHGCEQGDDERRTFGLPELQKAIAALCKGVTLVVTWLDPAGRSQWDHWFTHRQTF